jgi:PTS system glucitol/sorbitol-specific IIA component
MMSAYAYFTGEISGIGDDAVEMIEGGVMIFFAEPCPEALAEVAVVHRTVNADSVRDPQPGDRFLVGDQAVTLTRVGELVGENLRNLGHIVVYYGAGADDELLPGAVYATGRLTVPKVGDVLELSSAS